ncbi:CMK1 - Ca2+/calmodulin-dependent ser/thr protein kinase type [Penicillium alfredii]|uniref:CMK1 - Ca2+/calmodulin-dependent ser/thr protein kinase type n=1 Tax=Penicillium alfredii TaxID=1506179 RepID=A0A9W9K4I2_9EURO|nr:CMK1 - Ca2+/calmodulin-dependent ser/thr protein kinase type [Penicillium alfredii]KAJ5091832.1 CMK1 - Ca2+/calmodulin-dependent ser/thr protein kinase type [Penicillium alfredii]
MHLFPQLLLLASIIQISLIWSTSATPLLLPSIGLKSEIEASSEGYETVLPLESRDVKHSWWPFKKYDIPKGKQKSPKVYRVGANWWGRGGYKLELGPELGSGAYGTVTEATLYNNTHPEIEVATKKSKGYDMISGAILMKEVQDLSPYILPTISYFFVPGKPTTYWLVMPKRGMGNLFEVRRRTRLGMTRKVQLFRKLLDGLATMHHHGIAHRDLKLTNILMEDMDTPQWADFDAATKNKTISSFFGSNGHVSPGITQVKDHSPKSDDIFAAMMTFFWLTANDDSPGRLWEAIKKGEVEKSQLPDKIRKYIYGPSNEMVDVAADCLCKESEGRLDIDQLIERFESTPEYQDSLEMEC